MNPNKAMSNCKHIFMNSWKLHLLYKTNKQTNKNTNTELKSTLFYLLLSNKNFLGQDIKRSEAYIET